MSAVKRAVGSIGARFAPRESRKPLPRSALASIGVIAGWLFINLLAYGALLIPSDGEESLLADRSGAGVRPQRAASLPNTPFFGKAPVKTEKEPEVDLANIPITQLNLVLSGVLDNSAKDKASALVAEKGKPAQRLYVGDTLPGERNSTRSLWII
ncbi:type II secretion system protein N [Microbulbifer taiwanensis]|uniref:type II secretion system protein N n=1 Tax=Microbulbifer taiwanensis TaxID=986746 RepID=UPI0036069648